MSAICWVDFIIYIKNFFYIISIKEVKAIKYMSKMKYNLKSNKSNIIAQLQFFKNRDLHF